MKRLDVMIDAALYDQVHSLLSDPMRPDGRKKRGGLANLLTSLLAQWVHDNRKNSANLEDL